MKIVPFLTAACVWLMCLPANAAFYGSGIGGDALANTRVGFNSTAASYRFRASQSSQLSSFRFYYIGVAPGYGAGTGGMWTATIHADDGTSNHFPTGPELATQLVMPQTTHYAGKLVTFDVPATLTSGQLYHLVFTNVDPDPANNYFSVDAWYYDQVPTGAFGGRLNPKYPNTDWAHLVKFIGDQWETRVEYAPILELNYANGKHQGMSYGEASYSEGQVGFIEGTQNIVRERFTVTGGNKSITKIGFRVLREEGPCTGNLVVRIENSSGAVLRQVSIGCSGIVPGPAFDPDGSGWEPFGSAAKWKEVSIPWITLQNNSTYNLRISATGSGRYWAWVNRHLNHYDYTPATYFSDGNAQKTTNGGASWSSLGRVPGENDLQFYFR